MMDDMQLIENFVSTLYHRSKVFCNDAINEIKK